MSRISLFAMAGALLASSLNVYANTSKSDAVPDSMTVYAEYEHEYEKLPSIGGSTARTLTADGLRIGVDKVSSWYAVGGNVRARRTVGFLGAGFRQLDIDAKGTSFTVYGALQPTPGFFVGLGGKLDYDTGLAIGRVGTLDVTVTSVGVRPFVAVVIPTDDWRFDGSLGVDFSRTRIAFQGSRVTYSRVFEGLLDTKVSVPLSDIFTASAGAKARHLFREDVSLNGTQRDLWAADAHVGLTAALSKNQSLRFQARTRLFDAVEDSAEFHLRFSHKFD